MFYILWENNSVDVRRRFNNKGKDTAMLMKINELSNPVELRIQPI